MFKSGVRVLMIVIGFCIGWAIAEWERKHNHKCKYSPVMNFPDANSDSVAIGTTWKVVAHSHDTFQFVKTNLIYIESESMPGEAMIGDIRCVEPTRIGRAPVSADTILPLRPYHRPKKGIDTIVEVRSRNGNIISVNQTGGQTAGQISNIKIGGE